MSTLTEENHCLKNLRNSPNNQSFHFSEGNLSNSNDLIHLLNQIQWKNLTSLNLSSNKLRDITLLNYADKLECLDLSNNFLNNITSIISCKSLISLDISKNNIHELPELNRLPFLEKLNVSHNPLGNISGLWGCMNLRYLDMTSCHLNSYLLIGLNKNEIQLGAINPLEGSNNNLSIYTKETNRFIKNYPTLLGIPQLRFLNLSSNPKLSNVFNIQLNSNEWSWIQNNLYNNENLVAKQYFNKNLLDNDNKINSSCYGILPYKIEYLNLQGCNISFINGLTFMKRLNILNLSQNQIIDHQGLMPLKSLSCLHNLNLKNNPICDQNNYFQRIIFHLKNLKILDDRRVSIMDRVRANLYYEPTLEQVAREDHRINLLHQFTKPQRLRDCTLPNIDTPYPILAIIGPVGINKRQLRKFLCQQLDNYFIPLICHTDRLPKCNKLIKQFNSIHSIDSSNNNNTNNVVTITQLNNNPNNNNNEIDGVDYYFINKENFNKKQIDGEFIQTAQIMGYQYGLSWEILESIARRGLAGIVVGELELLYGLRLAGLKPRSILCLPNNLHHYERVIRVSISQIHCTQSGLSCDDNILETSLENTEKWINWYIQRTDQLYPQIHRDNPGLFDAVLSSDDTQELFQQLLLLILDYLGISSSNDLSNMQMNDNGITEIRSAP
uniref:Guanylate kinase-like domain-containing protein n=1 Tax=Schistosoma mansoni TaxID=6183 RepID=A0A5K4FFX5_SCHMA